MIHQKPFQSNHIYRFELTSNSAHYASEKAFNLYGILIIPILLGGILMYDVFKLTDEYFMYAFMVMVLTILNIYFFYQRMIKRNHILKLIIFDDYLQIMNSKQIYFNEKINLLDIEIIRCGIPLQSAIKISHEDFQDIIIGLKIPSSKIKTGTKHDLSNADYSLKTKPQSQALMDILQNRVVGTPFHS